MRNIILLLGALFFVTGCSKSDGELCIDLYNKIGTINLGEHFSPIKYVKSEMKNEEVIAYFNFDGDKSIYDLKCPYKSGETRNTENMKNAIKKKIGGEELFKTELIGRAFNYFNGRTAIAFPNHDTGSVTVLGYSKEGKKIKDRWKSLVYCNPLERSLFLSLHPPTGHDLKKYYRYDESIDIKVKRKGFKVTAGRAWVTEEGTKNESFVIDMTRRFDGVSLFEVFATLSRNSKSIKLSDEELMNGIKYGVRSDKYDDESIKISFGLNGLGGSISVPVYDIFSSSALQSCVNKI